MARPGRQDMELFFETFFVLKLDNKHPKNPSMKIIKTRSTQLSGLQHLNESNTEGTNFSILIVSGMGIAKKVVGEYRSERPGSRGNALLGRKQIFGPTPLPPRAQK